MATGYEHVAAEIRAIKNARVLPWLAGVLLISLAFNVLLGWGWWTASSACNARIALFEATNNDNGREIQSLQTKLEQERMEKATAKADLRDVKLERDDALLKLTTRATAREAKVKKVYENDAACRDWAARPVCPDVDGL
jgi:hypothetical protein